MNMNSPAIVITGASTGIGEACALELDRRGFRVFAGVRSEAAGEALRAKASPRLTPIHLDVTEADSIAAAAELVGKAVGESGLAGLVNNAGIAVPGPLEAVPIDAFRKQFEVNVIGVVAVTQAFLPLIRKARGRLVNISSLNGGLSLPYMGAYSASKFALEALSDALRAELCPWKIHVALVEPGPIDTPIWNKSVALADQLATQAAPEALSLYETDLAALRRTVGRIAGKASPVDRVVRAVVHALTADRPKIRYFLGFRVRFLFKGFRMAPDRLHDWIARKTMGLS
jgi:NAD(P)-dependent dehydrogenase (short-subunit alcohol dehydrogenase family)